MKVIKVKTYEEMSQKAFEVMHEVIVNKPDAVIGLATGTTPLGLYAKMIEDCKNGTDYSKVRTANLDEYKGLPKDHNQSYAYFMKKNLFDGLNIDQKNCNIENGMAEDAEAECKRYDELLDVMPQDIQLLGIGSNGHIAFNEPGTPFGSGTHVVDLTESTIKDNSRLFNDVSEVPTQAFSMGPKNIMRAKKLLMIVNGKNKAKAVYEMLYGPVTEKMPASICTLHPDFTLIVDEEAGSLI